MIREGNKVSSDEESNDFLINPEITENDIEEVLDRYFETRFNSISLAKEIGCDTSEYRGFHLLKSDSNDVQEICKNELY